MAHTVPIMPTCETSVVQDGRGNGCAAILPIEQRSPTFPSPLTITYTSFRSTALVPTGQDAGVCFFAEHSDTLGHSARLFWRADHDPAVLVVRAEAVSADDPDHIALDALPGRATLLVSTIQQHLLISDGARQLRLDIEGTLNAGPVRLHYQLAGIAGVEAQLHTLRRFLALLRLGRFARGLETAEPRVDRWILMLRAHDLAALGASQRDIAAELFGGHRVAAEWRTESDSLRLRVQRLLRDANRLVNGGYLALLGGGVN